MSHQELLNQYVEAELYHIGETSDNIERSVKLLRKKIANHVGRYKYLVFPTQLFDHFVFEVN